VVLLTDLDSFSGVLVRLDEREMAVPGSAASPSRSDPIKVRAGTHSLLCVKENTPPFMTTFDVAPDVTVEVSCKLRPQVAASGAPIVPVWAAATTLSAGVAVAAVGGALVGLYYKDQQYFEDNKATLKDWSSNKHYIGYALIGVGAAAVVTSVVLFTVKKPAEPQGYLGPVSWGAGVAPTPDGAMASAYLAF
jgi:hypothetical protein